LITCRVAFTLFPDETEERDRLAGVSFAVYIVSNLGPSEFFLERCEETFICLSSFLVTEIDLGGFVRYEIHKSLDEERESWFEVDTIGGKDHLVFVWDGRWEWVTPGAKTKKG